MDHIYIFDYSLHKLYHGIIRAELIDDYLIKHNLNPDNCHVMITETELTIENI